LYAAVSLAREQEKLLGLALFEIPEVQMPRRLAPVLLIALIAAACSSNGDGGPSEPPRTEVTVLAAASLTEALPAVATQFNQENPNVSVRFSFGPSDGLAQQIDGGAPVSVFASASPTWMDDVEENGPGITNRADFAQNKLTIITPADDPAGISSIADLAKPGVQLVLAAKGVPVGDYAREALKNAGIAKAALANVVSNAEDTKAVVQSVVQGDADAGIVYLTDVTTEVKPDVKEITIPDDVNVIATYPIGVVTGGPSAGDAADFVAFVLSDAGRAVLQSFGFLPPPS
jgi:molybdate transport system substrate-binding protein